jgi:hypothetical protein
MRTISAVDGMILASDLGVMGWDGREYRRARERGELHRPHRGVYVDARYWWGLKPSDRYVLQVLGAARASRSVPTVSHVSAAALWGVPLLGALPKFVHVLSSVSVGTRAEGGFRRHASRAPDLGVTKHRGARVTTLARTLAEFAADMPFRDSVAALDWALLPSTVGRPKPSVTGPEILTMADQLGIERGRRRLEAAVDFADSKSGSAGESLSRVLMHELGLPKPQLQVDFSDRHGFIGTVDFWWPQHNLIGEFDGVAKYTRDEFTAGKSTAEVIIQEKNRENRLRATGPGVTRWDWAVADSPVSLLAHLTAAGLPSTRRRHR